MSTTNPLIGQLFQFPGGQPLSSDGKLMGYAYRIFYLTNSTTPVPVYKDAALLLPYQNSTVLASVSGTFPPVYLNPAIEYRSQLFNSAGQLLEDIDPVNNNTAGGPAITGVVTVGAVAGFARAAYKAATTARSVGTILADPDLSVLLPGAGTYKIDMDLAFTASSAGFGGSSLLFELEYSGTLGSGTLLPGTGTGFFAFPTMGAWNGVATDVFAVQLGLLSEPIAGLGLTAVSNTVRISGVFQALSSGTFALYWAPANSGTTSLLAGASLTIQQVI